MHVLEILLKRKSNENKPIKTLFKWVDTKLLEGLGCIFNIFINAFMRNNLK
jgi:hypothetical protein